MTDKIKEEITELLCSIISIESSEQVNKDTILSAIGLDSIRFIEFIVALEEKYDIEVYDSDLILSNFSTLEVIFETMDKYFHDESVQKLYKCIITDCDGVLWKGIAGEVGIDEPRLDDSSIAIQSKLKSLRQMGIYLCLCTKNSSNNIAAMLEADSPLELSDIAVSEYDVSDKSKAVKRILSSLKVSPESAVFIDDSIYECSLVESLIPKITVIQADNTDYEFIGTLTGLFSNISDNMLDRTKLYREQKEREKIHISAIDADDYNHRLNTNISCFIAANEHTSRIAELSQRTNRFNLSGNRYTKEQLDSLIGSGNCSIYALTAEDIYGDMGLVAAAVVCENTIESFMLSCRVFGRRFENVLIEKIKSDHVGKLCGIFHETEQNKEQSQFYTELGIEAIYR